MKGRAKLVYAFILSSLLFAGGYNFVRADSGTTSGGTVDDPLVTKSYVDSLLKGGGTSAAQQSGTPITEDKIKQIINEQLKAATPSTVTTTTTTEPTSSTITIVQLKNGQTLYAGAGAELIVRTGKTVAVSIDDNGIPDVTAGKDIPAGATIEANHLLIFPREGRGIKAAPKNTADIYVMVRGAYSILNEDETKVTQ
ncbi:hypothetical protein ACFFK0_10650 [Paenibacillus chartarius]|uniref:Uncharacterized protein n=1 Tax=Paenibacillus chartarius TaxID=747481 RepID=A0ABV6DJU6_9BACL